MFEKRWPRNRTSSAYSGEDMLDLYLTRAEPSSVSIRGRSADSAELDLDPRAAPDASRGARQELGDPHLQAVLRAKRGARPVDHLGLGDDPGRRGLPWPLDAAPAVRGSHFHSGRVTQALHLAGVAGRDHVETRAERGEPDGGGHLGAVAPERREAHVAMAVEVAGGAHDGAMVPSGPWFSRNDGPRGREERSWASSKARWRW